MMEDQILMEQVLEFAIAEEEAAADFYAKMAGRAKVSAMREVFEGFALEEKRHKAKLEAVKLTGQLEVTARQPAMSLRLADYLTDEFSPDLDYRSALMLAIKKEKAAFKLYSDLAAAAPTDALKKTFWILAQEEVSHQLHFETEYSNLISGRESG